MRLRISNGHAFSAIETQAMALKNELNYIR